jgi:hypothetical protein
MACPLRSSYASAMVPEPQRSALKQALPTVTRPPPLAADRGWPGLLRRCGQHPLRCHRPASSRAQPMGRATEYLEMGHGSQE